ncbi:Dynein heavy chain [Glycine soja]
MEASKEKMDTMMEAMMSIKEIMKVNVVAIVATSTIAEGGLTPPYGLNQINHPTSDIVGLEGKELAESSSDSVSSAASSSSSAASSSSSAASPSSSAASSSSMPLSESLLISSSSSIFFSVVALMGHESFKEYAQRWKDMVAQAVPPMTEREMITVIVDTLPVFTNLVFVGERIEVGLKRGKFDHPALTNEKTRANEEDENEEGTHVVVVIPTWPNFPPAQQCHRSANIGPFHYPPPSHPQRSSLNYPQSLLVAHPMPSANQNTNQEMNFAAKKPVEFTPIPVSYADLLPYLLDNSMVAITPAKGDPWVLIPIAFRRLHALVFRGLHVLDFRGLHVLALRGLHVLAFRGGLHVLTFSGLHVLTLRGLHIFAFRGLHALAFKRLHALTFRGLHVLAFRGLHVLAPSPLEDCTGLHVFAFRGMHVLAFKGLHVLVFRGLHVLALRGLHILAFKGLHTLAFRGLHVLTFGGLHVLAFRGLHVLTFRGLHVLAFRGFHILAFKGLHVLAFRGLHALAFRGLHALAFRGLHALTFRGLHVLAFKGLHVLTFKGLHVLTFRGLHVLAFRGLHVLAFRGLHILAFRGLPVLAFRGLHILTFRGLHILAFRGLHVLAFRGLHALTFKGFHVLAVRGLHVLAFRGLHVLAFRGLQVLAFKGLHVLTFRGLHICAFRVLKVLLFISGKCTGSRKYDALNRMALCLANMHSSSFFQILPRAQLRSVMLREWLTKPEDWLSERGEESVVSLYQFLGHPFDLRGGPTVRVQPKEEARLQLRRGGYRAATMHTGARFRPDRCRETRITPPRHLVDPKKSNRVLGFPTLIIGLCQFYGVPITPSKRPRNDQQRATNTSPPPPEPLNSSTKVEALPTTHGRPACGQPPGQARDQQINIPCPTQDVKEALLGGNLELAIKKLPAKRSRRGTIEEGSSATPQADTGFDKHRFQSAEHQ